MVTAIEFFSSLNSVLLTGAAVGGATTALMGLNTWKKQLNWQTDHDLARRILVSLYRYRDAINGVRHPAMFAYEMPEPPEQEREGMTAEQRRFYGLSKAYGNRWEKVTDTNAELYPDFLEAEAVWGKTLSDLMKPIRELQHELFTNVRQYLEVCDPDGDKSRKTAVEKIMRKNRDVLYDDLSDGDEFKNNFRVAIEKIEEYLKPKLGSKN